MTTAYFYLFPSQHIALGDTLIPHWLQLLIHYSSSSRILINETGQTQQQWLAADDGTPFRLHSTLPNSSSSCWLAAWYLFPAGISRKPSMRFSQHKNSRIAICNHQSGSRTATAAKSSWINGNHCPYFLLRWVADATFWLSSSLSSHSGIE